MNILFDELEKDVPSEYETVQGRFTIDISFSSDDPEEIVRFVKKKLEKVRTNIVCWKMLNCGKIAVGVGHFYCETDFGQPIYPHWWVE